MQLNLLQDSADYVEFGAGKGNASTECSAHIYLRRNQHFAATWALTARWLTNAEQRISRDAFLTEFQFNAIEVVLCSAFVFCMLANFTVG